MAKESPSSIVINKLPLKMFDFKGMQIVPALVGLKS